MTPSARQRWRHIEFSTQQGERGKPRRILSVAHIVEATGFYPICHSRTIDWNSGLIVWHYWTGKKRGALDVSRSPESIPAVRRSDLVVVLEGSAAAPAVQGFVVI